MIAFFVGMYVGGLLGIFGMCLFMIGGDDEWHNLKKYITKDILFDIT